MTEAQRAALLGMMEAILACDCAPPDIRLRATGLRLRISCGDRFGDVFDRVIG